ncbi:MAG TPA: DEAD/DEAH box helicase [Chloroflexota bacterium]|nr:DEAD/DEAH box helicase [Chloroflexota bacterium]
MELLERPDAEPAEPAVDEGLLEALAGDAVSSGEAGVPSLDEELLERFALPCQPSLGVHPRPYQREALERWLRNQGRGVVVLPTGAGKTVVAYMALEQAPVRTLVVVPTIDLLRQWRRGLVERAGVPAEMVGVVGGGERKTAPVTVITYDSAAMPRRRLDGYGLLIVDEVHHLPAPTYRAIAAKVSAPFRLGLSATPERKDGGHFALDDLVGPEVYRRVPAELASTGHIANYREKRIFVDLTPEERYRYDAVMAEYRWYVATRRAQLVGGSFFDALIRRSGFDPGARRALQAHHEARMISLNAEGKIAQVEALLKRHRDEHVIVFSEYNAMVDVLSRRLALPAITYRTHPDERRLILERFRSGQYSKVVTGRVLNEGVDVPDASVAIVVSGSSATREHIQRLGRVLRPKPKGAVLYEIISRGTTEGRASRARRGAASGFAARNDPRGMIRRRSASR